jgi:hypothetical protein
MNIISLRFLVYQMFDKLIVLIFVRKHQTPNTLFTFLTQKISSMLDHKFGHFFSILLPNRQKMSFLEQTLFSSFKIYLNFMVKYHL